ncbi:MAG: iron-sulfur cluster assembly protein [Patescibacteria group bacterium]
MISQEIIYQHLGKVLDPELNIDIVSLGLIYDVTIGKKQTEAGEVEHVHVLMTLTTPGCPLAHVFEDMIKDALDQIPEFEAYQHVTTELTFDPPWIPDMMSEEAKAELEL